MKRIKNICLLLFSTLFLPSCSLKSDETIARELYSSIVDYTLEKNKDSLISLFSKNIYSNIENFDSQVDELLNYVSGSYISFEYALGTGVDTLRQNFNRIEFIYNAASELYTTESKYFLSILYCSVDDYDSDNVGIWNLMVQKCNDGDGFISYSNYEERKEGNTYRGITLI